MSSSKLIPRFCRPPRGKRAAAKQFVQTEKEQVGQATKVIRHKIRKVTKKNTKDSGQNAAVCLCHAQLGTQASQVTEVFQILY